MSEINSSDIEVTVDPENMRARRFGLPNVRALPNAMFIARELEKNDPSLSVTEIERLDIVLETPDSGDWMASSGQELGTPRQDYVLRRLGIVGLS